MSETHVERRHQRRSPGRRVAEVLHLLQVLAVGGVGLLLRLRHVEHRLQGRLERRDAEHVAEHLQVVAVGEPVERRQRDLPEALQLGAHAREDLVEGEPVGVGDELGQLVGLDVLVLDPLERRVVAEAALLPRPHDLLVAVGGEEVRGEHVVGGREVPAEAERGLLGGLPAGLVVVPGVLVGDPLDQRREVVHVERHDGHAVGLLERDRVVEALLALRVELLGRRHAALPVHSAARRRAAAASRPQPSAPV